MTGLNPGIEQPSTYAYRQSDWFYKGPGDVLVNCVTLKLPWSAMEKDREPNEL